jgi:hypothetical protein
METKGNPPGIVRDILIGGGIAAIGVGIGYGVYRWITARPGAEILERAAQSVEAEIVRKRREMEITKDPARRAELREDIQKEMEVWSDLVKRAADAAARSPLDLIATGIVGMGFVVAFAWAAPKIYELWSKIHAARAKPTNVLEFWSMDALLYQTFPFTAEEAVMLGITAERAYLVGLTAEAIRAAEAELGFSAATRMMPTIEPAAVTKMSNASVVVMSGAPTTATVATATTQVASAATAAATGMITAATIAAASLPVVAFAVWYFLPFIICYRRALREMGVKL